MPRNPLLADANVIIDFCKAERSMLTLISTHIGRIHVLTPVAADEVVHLVEHEYAELGMVLVEPELGHLLAAGQKQGRLSFNDRLCLIVARERGWTCLTNDVPLRRECEAQGVLVMWGLESLALLVENNKLAPGDAKAVATQIHFVNPLHINEAVIDRFLRRIGTRGSGHR